MSSLRRLLVFSFCALAVVACNDDNGSDTTAGGDTDTGIGTDGGDAGSDAPTRDVGSPDVAPDGAEDTARPDTGGPDVRIPDVSTDTGGGAECGNGVREPGEICDGDDLLAGVTCEDYDFFAGELACSATCTVVTEGCYDALCGDGLVTGDEDCEPEGSGEAPVEETCVDLGFAPGGDDAVYCGSDCFFDTGECSASICGNGVLEAAAEVCDDTDFGDESCRGLGFFGGDLNCTDACDSFDDAGCVPNICGNGTVEGDEVCDGAGAVGLSCVIFGEGEGSGEGSGGEGSGDADGTYIGGFVGCDDDCFGLDYSTCIEAGGEPFADADEDTVPDGDDNCVDIFNPNQLDADADGIGNVCDEPLRYAAIIEEEGANQVTITASGEIPLIGTEIATPLTLPIESAEILVWFDDGGEMYAELVVAAFGDTDADIEIGALPIPIPIPGLDGFTISVTDAQFTSAEPRNIVTPTTVEAMLTGEVSGDNGASIVLLDLTAGAAGAEGVSLEGAEVVLDASSSAHSMFFETYRWEFDDADAEIGTFAVDLGAGGGFPIPIPLDFDVTLTGFSGSVYVGVAE